MRGTHFGNNIALVLTPICLFQSNVAKNLAPSLKESPKSEEVLLLANSVEDFLREGLEDFRTRLPDGFQEYEIPSLDPLHTHNLSFNISSDMVELYFKNSKSNLTNLSNFNTDLVYVDLDASHQLEITMDVAEMRVDGEFFMDGMILDIFTVYGNGPYWIKIDGVKISAKSEVQLNGQGFIQVSNMNASTTFSDVEMQINDCMFCPNGEAVQVILNTIGTRVWNEAEQLLVDLLQQALQNFLAKEFQKCSAEMILSEECP